MTSYRPVFVFQIFIQCYYCNWTCKTEMRIIQSIPWHSVPFEYFNHIFPSKYWVRVQSLTSVLHFKLSSFSLILSTKYYFVKICHPCFLYFWHASSWISTTLPYSTHKSRTIILQNSCFAAGWPTIAHAYQQCTETRRPPGRLFWATEPNWNFSFKLFTCQEKYLCSHLIKLLMS